MSDGFKHPRNSASCIDILNDVISGPTVFQDESKLSFDYVPNVLLHRDQEFRQIAQYFRHMITEPQSMAQKVIISGPIGCGKTALARRFGQDFETLARSKLNENSYSPSFFFLHINCRLQASPYQIFLHIMRYFNASFPQRGYSVQEILDSLLSSLRAHKRSLLLALDEVDYLGKLPKGKNLIYDILRYGEESKNEEKPLSIIFVSRDVNFLDSLDESIQSYLPKNHIILRPYNIEHLREIIQARAELALKNNGLSSDALDLIAEISFQHDARYAMELLWRAGKKADNERSLKINSEHVRAAIATLTLCNEFEILDSLTESQKSLLIAISHELNEHDAIYIDEESVSDRFIERNTENQENDFLSLFKEDLDYLKRIGLIKSKENRIYMEILPYSLLKNF